MLAEVITNVHPTRKSLVNTSLDGHRLYEGQIKRHLYQTDKGAWRVKILGYGNNYIPGANIANEVYGPLIFNKVDSQMTKYLTDKYK